MNDPQKLFQRLHVFICFFLIFPILLAEEKTSSMTKEEDPVISHSPEEIKKIHESAESLTITDNYVHQWIPYPTLEIPFVNSELKKIEPLYGVVEVTVFLASWCVKCQEMIGDLKIVQQKFEKKFTHFTYVFTHDLEKDVKGFLQEYKLEDGGLATQKTLEDFKNPPLPSIYIRDRRGWMLTRFLKFKKEKDIIELNKLLSYLNAY